MLTARKGISSLQLSKEPGITQKSSWYMLQRIREASKQGSFRPPNKKRVGKVKAMVVDRTNTETLQGKVQSNIQAKSTVIDVFREYIGINRISYKELTG